jgi:hypothetical protein
MDHGKYFNQLHRQFMVSQRMAEERPHVFAAQRFSRYLSERCAVRGATVVELLASQTQTPMLTVSTVVPPVDPRWPDRGPGRGTVTFGEHSVPVLDCVVGATEGSTLFVGDAAPVRRAAPGWAFVVLHVPPAGGPVISEGGHVTLTVDAEHRATLSAGHTGCRIAAVARTEAISVDLGLDEAASELIMTTSVRR